MLNVIYYQLHSQTCLFILQDTKMKFRQLFAFLLLVISALSIPNLFLGTAGFGFGCGSNSPAVQVPFSFVRLGPDTTTKNKIIYAPFQHYGGYDNTDKAIRAFSHMHLVGAGVLDMGIFGVLPKICKDIEKMPTVPSDQSVGFYKDQEIARPGYYSTQLQNNIKVQLTTSQHCGAHRYTQYNRRNNPIDINIMTSYLLQKKTNRFTTTHVCGERCLEGKIWATGSFGGRFGGYNVHYHLQWISDATQLEQIYLYQGAQIFKISQIKDTVSHNNTGAVIRTKSNNLEIYIGISYVSIKNARQNFEQQIKGKNFEAIKNEAQQTWAEQMKRFDILAVNPTVQTKIDTAIYRTLLTPTIFQDWNGDYVSFRNDGTIKNKPASMSNIYTDMSLWDVHRTQMPWLLFSDPHRFQDIAMSIVLINREGGYMPKWPFAQGATGCMIGAHANTVLADWIVKQAYFDSQINKTQILGYMVRNANDQTPHDNRKAIQQYLKLGYLPADLGASSSSSQTLEYSYNDFGIGKIAELLNKTEIAKEFQLRSKFYKNVWNPKTKFFEPKFRNQTFKHISIPQRVNILSSNYVQGDAWHYRFYAPHDAQGLIQLFGGQKKFLVQLNKFFARSFSWPTLWLPNPYYWAGNQHDLFSVWLFSYANRPDLTQKYSKKIIDNFYGTQGDGLPGNDDYGTMSAWLIFASLGFYPLPSTQTYILGSPYIHYAKIQRRVKNNEFVPFTIRVHNNNKNKWEVKKTLINEKEADKFIKHSDIKNNNMGSYLQFEMK